MTPAGRPKRIAILGAGNGGTAMAGDLTLAGHECRLYEFEEWAQNVAAVEARGGIKVTGVAHTGLARVALATTQLAKAVEDVELIMVTTQALAHGRLAAALAPLLRSGQAIVLWPGSGGTLLLRRLWDDLGVTADVILGEAATLPYACRRPEGPGTVSIHRVAGPSNYVAALPATRTPQLMSALDGVYSTVVPARSVLEPALYNANIIVHPVGALLNMGRIEHTNGEFWLYKEGITPSVKKVIVAMDGERQAVMTALGHAPKTWEQVFGELIGCSYEEFAAVSSQGPFSMKDRYITEDVPTGVTLTASLGRAVGVRTPTFDAMIHLASVVNGTDYYATGRTVASLGLEGLSAEQMARYVMTGEREQVVAPGR